MTGRLIALDVAPGPEFVTTLLGVWDAGDAAFPLDPRLPRGVADGILDAMAPAAVVTAGGRRTVRRGARGVEAGDAVVVATSGTTGSPRGAVLTHAAVRASARASNARLGVTADDHWIACLPLAHVGGLSVVLRALEAGCGLTVLPRFDAAAVLAAADAARAEGRRPFVSLVATALARVDAARFQTVLLGGSRPPAAPPPNAVVTYGMTETGSGVVYDGYPLDGVDVRVVDGEIHVRGPMLLRAYRDGTVPLVDGWFATGDLGHLDDDGRLVVEGRRGNVIVTGGEKVWPDPVEEVLASHPAVADVAVIGTPDAEWGAAVTACVVPEGDAPTLDALRDHARARLAPYALPRRLVLVDAVPRTALGKVARAELARRLP